MHTLEGIRAAVEERARLIDAPTPVLPTYGRSEDFARPHIEVGRTGKLHWVVIERGQELERRSTRDLHELLYWVFQSVTFSMASSYELRHRRPDEDSRKQLFTHQLGLLARLDPAWAARRRHELGTLLRDAGVEP